MSPSPRVVGLGRFELPTFGPQIDQPQTPDLHKRPETCRDLQFWLITGSRRFALFRDVSRPVRGLTKVRVCHPRGCLHGCLLEGHSGGYRIETPRPTGVLVGSCSVKARSGQVRPGQVRPGQVCPFEVRPVEFRPVEVRPSRSWPSPSPSPTTSPGGAPVPASHCHPGRGPRGPVPSGDRGCAMGSVHPC